MMKPIPDRSTSVGKRTKLPVSWVAVTASVLLSACGYIGGAFKGPPSELHATADEGTRQLIESAFAGLQTSNIVDHHVHAFGLGVGGTGAFANPKIHEPVTHPYKYIQFRVYKNAAAIENEDNADREYIERLVALARAIEGHGKFLLLAFDKHFNTDGTVNLEKTEFYVPNRYVFELSEEFPDLFVPAMSVNPYRHDAIQALEKWAGRGARYLKWLPNAMGIDPSDPKLVPFYRKMAELDVALLTHVGKEYAVEATGDQALGNPLFLRRPLDSGVKVIAAHCASLGRSRDLDDPKQPQVDNFDLFMRLMDEPRYDGLLFGEISSITQSNRLPDVLRELLERPDLHHRLVNGSDYPLPAVNVLVSTRRLVRHGFITPGQREALNTIYEFNPLLFDFVLKRTVSHPDTGQKFASSVFEGHPALP